MARVFKMSGYLVQNTRCILIVCNPLSIIKLWN